MKKSITYILSIALCVFYTSCEDLLRDNPLDQNGSNNDTVQQYDSSHIEFSRYTVYSDNNNDDLINKGESVELLVYLKNSGTSRANGVRATITCNSQYISSLSPTTAISFYSSSYSDFIDDDSEGFAYNSGSFIYNYLNFNVSNATPDNTVITFNLSITDEDGNSWTESFNVTVVATGANLEFSRYTVNSDNNNDGLINKGESVELLVYLKNSGTSRANGVRATITCNSQYISSLSPTTAISFYSSSYSDFIDDDSEGFAYNSGSFIYNYLNFNVSNATPDNTEITFNLSITDESDNIWSDSFTITVY